MECERRAGFVRDVSKMLGMATVLSESLICMCLHLSLKRDGENEVSWVYVG